MRESASRDGALALFSSSMNLTYPPSGTQATRQRVPCRSQKPKISRPKPIEKALTRTPHQRATRKWPSSWMKTTTVRTNKKGTRTARKPQACSKILPKVMHAPRQISRSSRPRNSPSRMAIDSVSERSCIGCLGPRRLGSARQPSSFQQIQRQLASRRVGCKYRAQVCGLRQETTPLSLCQRLGYKLGNLKEP